ncbi:MAG: PilZ domain-containing protein [Phycisphaerales bacterium]|nr:PilZ domain-containing protein [Phycisphaerales bacterium]
MLGLTHNARDSHDHDAPETYVFDRRRAGRAPASGAMQAVLANGRQMPWVLRLGLVNASHGGLCVTTDAPIEPGSRLSLRVDPVHGNWTTGTVVRCEPLEDGYRVGIAYEQRRAA